MSLSSFRRLFSGAAFCLIAVAVVGAQQIIEESVAIPVSERNVEIPATVVTPRGDGPFPLVVMAHGHGGSREENGGFAALAQAMGRDGIASVRMDFPGCGESTESFRRNTLSNMITDVGAAIEYVRAAYNIDASRLGLFGYSMGGRIALSVATGTTYDVDGLVLLAPAADGSTMVDFVGGQAAWDALYATAQRDGYAVFTTPFGARQELSEEWFADLLAFDPIDRADEYRGVSLVMYGEDDPIVPAAVSTATARALGAATLDVTGDSHSYSFYSDSPAIRSAIIDGTVETFHAAFR